MINNKKILALVPARGGSKGIKLKNLKKINGKSLIKITSEFIDECKFFDFKIISTDHKKIINESNKLGFNIIKRNKKLSGDKISDYEVIINTINNLYKLTNIKFDYLVYLQPTSPIRKKKQLLETLKKVIKYNYDGAWSVSKVSTKYHPLKSLIIQNHKLRLFDNNGKNIVSRQMLNSSYIRNGVFYIFDIKRLKKNKSIYLKKIFPSITNYEIANIDNNNDLKIAKKIMKGN